MQTIEEFIHQYLDEHIADEKRQQASHRPFLQKFFTANYDHWNLQDRLEMFQSEKVESISESETKAEVVTRRQMPNSQGDYYDLRYVLQVHGDGWLICEVDVRCCACNGQPGKTDCPSCYGTGWRNTGRRKGCAN
jgi:hypothetical protein